MRITREADYAVRIISILCQRDKVMSAREICEETGVTVRFTLKILRKLAEDGIVCSQKGANGGYYLAQGREDISLGEVIECIDSPFAISHCLNETYECTRVSNKSCCQFHKIYAELNEKIKNELYAIKIKDVK